MKFKTLSTFALLISLSISARADLEPWEDYEVSDEVWSITTIKVDSNMGDAYLEGIRETWIPGNKISQELGHIEDWAIYRSALPESGDFNLMLVVKFASTADAAPNKARYEAFMKEFTEEMADRTTEYAQKNYPGMRTIVGEYMMHKIEVK